MSKKFLKGLCVAIGVLMLCVFIHIAEGKKAYAGTGGPKIDVIYDIDDIEEEIHYYAE